MRGPLVMAAIVASGTFSLIAGGCTRDQLHNIFPAEIEHEDQLRGVQPAASRQSASLTPTTEPAAKAEHGVDVTFPTAGRRQIVILPGNADVNVGVVGPGDMGGGDYGGFEEEQQ